LIFLSKLSTSGTKLGIEEWNNGWGVRLPTDEDDNDGGDNDDYCCRHVLIAIRAARSQTNKLCKFQLRQEIEFNQSKIKSNHNTRQNQIAQPERQNINLRNQCWRIVARVCLFVGFVNLWPSHVHCLLNDIRQTGRKITTITVSAIHNPHPIPSRNIITATIRLKDQQIQTQRQKKRQMQFDSVATS